MSFSAIVSCYCLDAGECGKQCNDDTQQHSGDTNKANSVINSGVEAVCIETVVLVVVSAVSSSSEELRLLARLLRCSISSGDIYGLLSLLFTI